jgi:hypothetical protein
MHFNPESLSFALSISDLGSIAGAANILGMKQATLSRKLTALDRADVRFIRPNIQIYDAHVVDLYQWVCAQYLVGVKGAETKFAGAPFRIKPRTLMLLKLLYNHNNYPAPAQWAWPSPDRLR